MKYIGMDAHSSTCSFCVVDELGTEVGSAEIETNGRMLVNYLKSVEGKKKLTFEECELSGWLYEILKAMVDELVVCNPVANRQYKKKKSDKLDARKLAHLLRGDFLVPVYHDGSAKEQLRAIMSAYEDLVGDAVRIKNRYKSLFRKEGNRMQGGALYRNESLLEGIKRKDHRFIGEQLYRSLEFMENERKKYVEEILNVSKAFKEISYLKSIPGIGNLQAAKILAQVIEPRRFRNKYKFYSYCGLARHMRSSGGKEYGSEKIWGNGRLKCVYKMAAHSILRGESELRKYYDRLRSKGVAHKAAKNAVSRKVASISLNVLKNQRRYRELMSDHLK